MFYIHTFRRLSPFSTAVHPSSFSSQLTRSVAIITMSIFSKIKGANKAAKEHKKKTAEPAEEVKNVPVPYRHIPTHAAIDALSGAPSSWREEDRSAIKAQHKRRSMLPRNDSSISATLSRNSSYGYNNSFRATEFGMTPARLEARKSYVGNSAYQPSPLNSHGMFVYQKFINSVASDIYRRSFPCRFRCKLNIIFIFS